MPTHQFCQQIREKGVFWLHCSSLGKQLVSMFLLPVSCLIAVGSSARMCLPHLLKETLGCGAWAGFCSVEENFLHSEVRL